jgi:hypothetical protein
MITEYFNNYSKTDIIYRTIEELQKIAFLDLKHFAKWDNKKIDINYDNPDLLNLVNVKISKNGTITVKQRYDKQKALDILCKLLVIYNFINEYEYKIINFPDKKKDKNIKEIIKKKYKIA